MIKGSHYIYILKCADNTLYTGSTNNLKRRVTEHNFSNKGAHYTKTRRPVKLLYSEKYKTLSEALRREWQIKQFQRKDKLKLIKS
jgi:putative endonuclease